jgi:sialidase-1
MANTRRPLRAFFPSLRFIAAIAAGGAAVLAATPAVAQELTLHEKLQPMEGLSVGPFVRLGDGSILTAGRKEALISSDEGKNWTRYPIFENPDAFDISSRAIQRTPEGVVVIAFSNMRERNWTWNAETREAPGAVLPTYAVRSLDDGRTWEKPQKLHDEWTGANRDMIVTRDGKLVFTSMMTRDNPLRHAVLTYTSEDQGESWIRSNIVDLGGAGNHGGVTEATLEELTDGRLMKLIRTNWGEFWRAESKDGGRYWHPMGPSGIPASSTPGILKRLESGRLMLIWNQPKPEGVEDYRKVGGDNIWSSVPTSNHRSELSLAFSEDDGRTWSAPVIVARIETGGYRGRHRHMPIHEISYPFVFEASPGEVWLTTWRGPLRARFFEKDFVGVEPAESASIR